MATEQDDAEIAALVRAAERAIAAARGLAVRLERPERLTDAQRRTLALRCRVHAPVEVGLPATVIVKRVSLEGYDPDQPDGVAARLFNDWAGVAYLSSLPGVTACGPRWYGGDRAAGMMVLEDLGQEATLVGPLLGGDAAAAERALLALAEALGRMHAATIGRYDTYRAARRALGPLSVATFSHTPARLLAHLDEIMAPFAELGQAVDAGARDEIAATLAALQTPGPFWAYTHGDPCPDNAFIQPDGTVRLIDFEMGAYRHALIDGVYGLMQFPTCWCARRIPEAVLARMEATYRGALVRGCAAARDDALWDHAVAQASAYWVLTSSWWWLAEVLAADQEWGVSWVRPRLVTRLETFARLATERGHLPALADFARRVSAAMRRRWPPERHELPLYPAFGGPRPDRST